MKRTFFITALLIFLLFSCKNDTKKNNKTTVDKSISKIEVIDFHSTHRCMTCNAIEENTKYTLKKYFLVELKDKKITFKTINVDEKANESIAEKFEATGTSLFLNVISKGKEKQVNLTDFAFMKGNDRENFSVELKTKIEAALADL